MYVVCGYLVTPTCKKAIRVGNFMGWPLFTVNNVSKYYPETAETPKGHLNYAQKNARSVKPKNNPSKG